MRILVVEDNRDILANVLDYLALKGYSVDCAQDGLSGLHLAATEHYDLIVLDIMLPGMDGYQLCKRLREDARRDTPIISIGTFVWQYCAANSEAVSRSVSNW